MCLRCLGLAAGGELTGGKLEVRFAGERAGVALADVWGDQALTGFQGLDRETQFAHLVPTCLDWRGGHDFESDGGVSCHGLERWVS